MSKEVVASVTCCVCVCVCCEKGGGGRVLVKDISSQVRNVLSRVYIIMSSNKLAVQITTCGWCSGKQEKLLSVMLASSMGTSMHAYSLISVSQT